MLEISGEVMFHPKISLNRHKVILVLLVLTLGAIRVPANETKSQFWFDFNLSGNVSERVNLYGKIGVRTSYPYAWTRYLLTPALKINLPRFILNDRKYKEELHLGVGLYYTDNRYYSDQLEIRPYQSYSLSLPNTRTIVINHYLMLEERFEMNTSDWVNTFGLRLRYRASITIRFDGRYWAPGNGFYLPVSAEFFWNLIGTKQFNDKIRILAGIGYDFPSQWKTVFLFGYNLSRSVQNSDFNNHDMMFRLRVYYKFN